MAMQLKLFLKMKVKNYCRDFRCIYLAKVKTSVVATVDAEVGVTRLDYKIADNDRDAILQQNEQH